jgi:YidC/Oxa1 family membrane protein insertase
MNDHKNTILAIVLSGMVLIAWQYFFGMPQLEKQRQVQQQQQQTQQGTQPGTQPAPQATPQPGTPSGPGPQVPGQPSPTAGPQLSRDAVLAASPRVPIDTPRLKGSVSLKGGRIDDLSLSQYRVTVDPNSPPVVLLSPSGAPHAFYGQFGWVSAGGGAGAAGAPGANAPKLPGDDTVWTQEGSGALALGQPVTLTWDNAEGLTFRRTISVDERYLFSVHDEVANKGSAPVALYPYALISRHGTPETSGFAVLHEGIVGVLGDQGLQEVAYKTVEDKKTIDFNVTNAWFGITDKYWAAALLPDPKDKVQARFSAGQSGQLKTYQTSYLLDPVTVEPGATAAANARLFAGAKEVEVVDGYNNALHLNKFDRLIDWGWFYFITKPMFSAIDWLFKFSGNFGIAILLVTVLIKFVFFPLANKSYASMAKMKAIQPQLTMVRERYADDKMKQQQAMMELYKKEKINPLAGCLPIAIQIPVFFALYKVLVVTIEMRHAPFFGWIHDLSAPDPTNVFTLFGLIPFDPTVIPVFGSYLHMGLWPLIMGVTMWMQMKLNPAPPDPTQKMIFDWMPVIFTFMLANFAAGLVIYWAWNNSLSVIQQSIIMRKNGAKIELFDNLKALVGKRDRA